MNDGYAREVLRAGQDLGISERGVVIAFATVFVESGWLMYANQSDPESLTFPHEALSFDANSVGLFQQRAEWWGTCADRMDPYRSAVLFFNSLKRYDYNNESFSPGFWAQKVQGSAFPDRYDTRVGDAQALYDRLVSPPSSKANMEKVLNYDRGIVGQETGWWCGPAATQIVLNGRGIKLAESAIAAQIEELENPGRGDDRDGTDFVGLIEQFLDRQVPEAKYTSVFMPNDPPTKAQKDKLWLDLKASIDAGWGVVANFVAPPSNYPRGVKGSTSPRYSGGTVYHYVALMGYDDSGARAVWVADSGFQPQGYWISFDQCASLIPPKGYAYSQAAPVAPPPPPTQADSLREQLADLYMEFDAAIFGDLDAIEYVVAQKDVRSKRVLAYLERTNPEALRAFIEREKG